MDIKKNHKNEPTDKPKQLDEVSEVASKIETKEEQKEVKPAKKIKRQATEEQLNHPLHGVKLSQILEQLVDHYGWE